VNGNPPNFWQRYKGCVEYFNFMLQLTQFSHARHEIKVIRVVIRQNWTPFHPKITSMSECWQTSLKQQSLIQNITVLTISQAICCISN